MHTATLNLIIYDTLMLLGEEISPEDARLGFMTAKI
jgi:hypothetical protein